MGASKLKRLLAVAAACVVLAGPVAAHPWNADQRAWPGDVRRQGRDFARRPQRGYQEPAFSRGYSDGYSTGAADGRGRNGYDPVRHKDYRQGDIGYFSAYGSKDAYRNNYRAGFRQGYEEGYRDSTR